MDHAQQCGVSERRACRLVYQPRGTQRYQPTQRNDEDALTRAMFNGLGNRFLFVPCKRSKILPEAGIVDPNAFNHLVIRISEAIAFAYNAGEFHMDAEAKQLWKTCYAQFPDVPGLFGALTSRAEAHVIRFALIYALLDCSPGVIRIQHLKAALAVWKYCENGVRYIFGDAQTVPLDNAILKLVRDAGTDGVTKTDLHQTTL